MSWFKIKSKMRSGSPSELGEAALEFALVLPLLCILTLGMADVGLYYLRSAQLNASLEAGVLYATSYVAPDNYGWSNSKPSSAADIANVVQKSVGVGNISMVSAPTCDFRCTIGIQIQASIAACVDSNGNANSPTLCGDGDYSGQYITISAQLSGGDSFLSSGLLNLSGYNLYPIKETVMVRVR
jgi:hypothetical protein